LEYNPALGEMKQMWWLITRSLYLDVMLLFVPKIRLYEKITFIFWKYYCIAHNIISKTNAQPRVGYAFGGPYYYHDEFATGLLQSIYVHNYRLREYIPADAVIVDVGANIGQFCTFAQHFLRARKVISFEPLAEPFTALQLNNKHVSLQIAIGADNGIAELYIDDRDILASLVAPANSESRRTKKRVIEIRRLDDLDVILGLEHIDLLKIDTEGSELDIVKASPLTIHKAAFMMIECSINPKSAGDIGRMMRYLSEAHPYLHVIDVMNPSSKQGRLECIDVLRENRKLSVKC
jgi:FkbM family methyltransferase